MTRAPLPHDVTLPDNFDEICHIAGELENMLFHATAPDFLADFRQAVAKFHELATAMGYSVTPLDESWVMGGKDTLEDVE